MTPPPISAAEALAVLGLLAKATLVVAVAGLAAACLLHRGASAAARHMVWALAIGAVLSLPVLSVLLPGWRVAVLREAEPVPASFSAPAGPLSAGPAEMDDEAASGRPAAAAPAPVPAAPAPIGVEWLLAGLYALVALALAGRVVAGRWSVARLARSATPLDSPEWRELLRDLVWVAEVERPVRLLRSDRATMPMTWGTRRPVVLLPAAADGWSAERRRVVLLHELAHVARRDCLLQTLAALACALYWVHPGVWYAARRMRAERELACDDRVLAAGTRARSYAAHLLEVARAFRPDGGASPVAVSMARPSQLEGRMLAVLDAVRSRRAPSRAASAAAAAVALTVSGLVAAVHPAVAKARPPAAPAEVRQAQEHVVEHTVAARPGGRLELVMDNEAAVEVTGWERDAVFVHAEFTGARAREGRVDAVAAAGGVRVTGRRPGAAGRQDKLRIWVPRHFDVAVRSRGGGVSIREVEGRFTGTSGGDGLHLDRLRGTVDFASEGGGVMIARSRLEGEIRTAGAGALLDRVTGGVNVVSGGGAVVRGRVDTGDGDGEHPAPANGQHVQVFPDPDPDPNPEIGLDCTAGTCTVVAERKDPAGTRAGGNGFAFLTGTGEERRAAVEAIARNAPPAAAAEALERLAFQETDPEVQREAAESLAGLRGGAGLAGLLKIARVHPGEEARREAAEGLGVLATTQAVAGLRRMVASDPDDGVQGEAVEAMAGILGRGDVPARTRQEVRAALREIARSHPVASVRARAHAETTDPPREISAGQPTGERLPLAPGARELALRNAGSASGADAAAIRRLRPALDHTPTSAMDLVRERATWALAQVRGGELIRPLVAALGDADWRVRAYAAWALGAAGERRGVNALAGALADPHWRVRANAASALAQVPDARAVTALGSVLRDPAWQVRAGAVEALGAIGDARAIAMVEPLLRDPHVAVRGAAQPAIAHLRSSRARG
ncbi:HEAT repeat domain-containing protein [Longimicrobium sp.]|jgi:HEAT repeat protein/beta-lactamase regulating signal transducer with metallopeptidase domain|uniref:HEAT repeat domain-containing protein n=1 Tax=Longimicrobium sp. TaxID=2029185 RepID=UPI002ED83553